MEIKNRIHNPDDNYRTTDNKKIIKDISLFLDEYRNISNNDFYRLLCIFYNISMDDKDYIDYINYKVNGNFDNIVKIETEVIDSYIDYEGHGRDFSWWTVKVRLCMKVAITGEIDNNKIYKIDEIKQLISDNKMYPVCYFYEKCDDRLCANRIKNDIDYLVKKEYGLLCVNDECFDYFMNNLRDRFEMEELFDEIRTYIVKEKMYLEYELRDYYSYDEKWIHKKLDLVNGLIDCYNKSIDLFNKYNNQSDDHVNKNILKDPVEIVADYLSRLPNIDRCCWYEEIEFEQIVRILESINYDENKELCEKIVKLVIDLGDPELCFSLASSYLINWVDFDQMMDIIIDSGDAEVNYEVLDETVDVLEPVYVLKHLKVVIDSDEAELNYKLALDDRFKDHINDFGVAVINSGNLWYNYLFALNIEGADVRRHGEVIIESGDLYYNYLFAMEVPGADVKRHYQVLVENDKNDEYKSVLKRILKK